MSHKGILISAVVGFALLPALASAQESTPSESQEPRPAVDEAALLQLDQVVPVGEEDEELVEVLPRTEAELLEEEFARYRQLINEGILDEADNVAKRVVELAIRVHGPESIEMARALTNLAIVQHRNEEYETAQQNYQAAIDIIEDNEDRLNNLLINPLRGLGAAQLESGRPDLAAQTYGRAVHITHVNDGPHNMAQLELLESLAETNLRMGLIKDAKRVHDSIYALNLRYYQSNPMEMVPSLMRRASWQHRTGYIIDERATYRRVIRIIESNAGKNDIRLIPALTNLGRSYFHVDMSGIEPINQPGSGTGEIYLKRALRIARESDEATWRHETGALLALGDFYLLLGSTVRARSQYQEAWELLSADDEKLQTRDSLLGQPRAVSISELPRYAGNATRADASNPDETLREGRITYSYGISTRGRVVNFRIVEASPSALYDIQRQVQREMRSRLYRPRYVDGDAVETPELTKTHIFYYRQSDLDALTEDSSADTDNEEDA